MLFHSLRCHRTKLVSKVTCNVWMCLTTTSDSINDKTDETDTVDIIAGTITQLFWLEKCDFIISPEGNIWFRWTREGWGLGIAQCTLILKMSADQRIKPSFGLRGKLWLQTLPEGNTCMKLLRCRAARFFPFPPGVPRLESSQPHVIVSFTAMLTIAMPTRTLWVTPFLPNPAWRGSKSAASWVILRGVLELLRGLTETKQNKRVNLVVVTLAHVSYVTSSAK